MRAPTEGQVGIPARPVVAAQEFFLCGEVCARVFRAGPSTTVVRLHFLDFQRVGALLQASNMLGPMFRSNTALRAIGPMSLWSPVAWPLKFATCISFLFDSQESLREQRPLVGHLAVNRRSVLCWRLGKAETTVTAEACMCKEVRRESLQYPLASQRC